MFTFRHLSIAITLQLSGVCAALAAPLTASQTLNQFNLITLGSANMASHVDGRSWIGGTLNGSGAVFAMHPSDMPASSYAGLTVGANASGLNVTAAGATVLGDLSNANINDGATVVSGNASNSNFNGSGGSYVYGSQSGVNSNSGSMSADAAAARLSVAQSTSFASVLGSTSSQLSALASTGSYWDISGNRVTFHAVANSSGLAVFDLTSVDDSLLSYGEFAFDYGSANTVVFNSDVQSATIAANFLGGSAQAIGSKTLWNFYQASSLSINSQFGGSLLATQAALTVNANIEGGVFVNSLAAQNAEIHLQAFSGTLPTATPVSSIPEPQSWALMLAGLSALLSVSRRLRLR